MLANLLTSLFQVGADGAILPSSCRALRRLSAGVRLTSGEGLMGDPRLRRRPGGDVGRAARACALVLGCTALANCSASDKFSNRVDPRYGVAASPRVVEPGEPVPKGGGA